MAATARTNSVDKNEAALNAVNSNMDALISQNKRLSSELDRLKSKEGGGKRVKFKEEEEAFFVEPQWCEHCKQDSYHLPHHCPTLPENKKKKEESKKRRGVKRER